MPDLDYECDDVAPEIQLRAELLDAEDNFRRLQAVYNNTPDPYGQLSARREDLERVISSYQVALAPHKKLPAELLGEIFLLCSAYPTPTALPPTTADPLLVITRVCHAWRELALHLPQLWAKISVSFDREGIDVERAAHIAERWLSRANDTSPLAITAQCTGPYTKAAQEKPELLSGFMALVLSHAPRSTHLDLTLPSETLRPLFSLPEGSFPRLETLSLQPQLSDKDLEPPDSGHCGWHWPEATTAFTSAPCLREVTFIPSMPCKMSEVFGDVVEPDEFEQLLALGGLTEIISVWSAPPVSLPWSQIRDLSFVLTAYTPNIWCSILSGCPNLEGCSLAVRPGDSSNSPLAAAAPISLLRLRKLYVVSFTGAGDQFLDSLVTPELSILALCGQILPSTISKFRIRSNFELASFVMTLHIAEGDVEPLFQNLSDIKTLLITPCFPTGHFPASVWDRMGRAELLPRLETLIMQPRPAQMPVLVDMIAGNWERAASSGRSPLVVKFWNAWPDHVAAVDEGLKGLERFAAAGNTVEIIYHDF